MERVLVCLPSPPSRREPGWDFGSTRRMIRGISRSSTPMAPSTPPARSWRGANQLGARAPRARAEAGRRGRGGAAQRRAAVHRLPGRAADRPLLRADQLPAERARGRVHPRGLRGEGVRESRAFRQARERGRRPHEDPGRGAPRARHVSPASARSTSSSMRSRPTCPKTVPTARRCTTPRAPPASPRGAARARRSRSRCQRRALHVLVAAVRHSAGRTRSAPQHVAELSHRGHHVRGQLAAHEAHRCVHGQVGRGGDAATDRAVRLLAHAHGSDAVHPHAAAARRGEGQVRRLRDEVGDPRGRAVPGRHQAQDARLVGPGHLGVLRRDRRWRNDRAARRVVEVPRHRGPRLAQRRC